MDTSTSDGDQWGFGTESSRGWGLIDEVELKWRSEIPLEDGNKCNTVKGRATILSLRRVGKSDKIARESRRDRLTLIPSRFSFSRCQKTDGRWQGGNCYCGSGLATLAKSDGPLHGKFCWDRGLLVLTANQRLSLA